MNDLGLLDVQQDALEMIQQVTKEQSLTWSALTQAMYATLESSYADLIKAAPFLVVKSTTITNDSTDSNDPCSPSYLHELQQSLGLDDATIDQAQRALKAFAPFFVNGGELLLKPNKAKGKYDLIFSADLAVKCLLLQHFIDHAPKLAQLKLCLGRERDNNFNLKVAGQTINYEDFLVFVENNNNTAYINLVCPSLKDKVSHKQLELIALSMFRSLFGDVISRIILVNNAQFEVCFDIPEHLQQKIDEAKRNQKELHLVNLKEFYKNYLSHGGKSLTKENNHIFISSYRDNTPWPKDQRSLELNHDIYEIDTLLTFALNLQGDFLQDKNNDLQLLESLGVVPVSIALSMQDDNGSAKSNLSRMENNQLLKDCERYLKRSNDEASFKVVGSALGTSHSYLHVLAFDYPKFVELMKSYQEQSKLPLCEVKLTTLA